MKLRFTPRATENLVAIADHIRAENPAAALRVRAAIYESIQNLISYSQAGRRQKSAGIRKLVTRKYAYLIYNTVDVEADEIVVLNVKHPAHEREHENTWSMHASDRNTLRLQQAGRGRSADARLHLPYGSLSNSGPKPWKCRFQP